MIQRTSHRAHHLFPLLLILALLFLPPGAVASDAALSTSTAPELVEWVGNLAPASGSETTIAGGDPFEVTVEAYWPGYTDYEGDNYLFGCTLYWGKVDTFGGAWTNITETPMSYFADSADVLNDVYKATISPMSGRYEFTAYCTDPDTQEPTWSELPNGNGRLIVTAPNFGECLGAAPDGNVYSSALRHDSFAADYRQPGGAVTNAQGTVTLRMRACRHDLTAAQLRVWDDRTDAETVYDMTVGPEALDPTLGEITYWTYDLPIPTDPTLLFYTFRLTDGTTTVYYSDDDPTFSGGGTGTTTADQATAEANSFQLTVYDQNFTVPDWLQRGIVYQIFPDRFRDGNSAINHSSGTFYYNVPNGSLLRSYTSDWNTLICDPRSVYTPSCPDKYGENFYGGDLQGIMAKINDGYFSNLGVTVLYLTPIFQSPSNHKEDTANYLMIDPDFGTSNSFKLFTAAAASKGIKVVLDGVFSYTSSDSAYFDLYSRFNYNDRLTNPSQPGPGNDDNISACESPNSARRAWYFIPDTGSPASGATDRCDPTDTDDRQGAWTETYDALNGSGRLPELNTTATAPKVQGVHDLFYAKGLTPPSPSVGPSWIKQGIDGWRLDRGGAVDPGLTNDPANTFWEGFRNAIRDTSIQTRTVPAMIGEEWGDASAWLLGNEWDSAMNYRLRAAALGWLFTGCTGDGCTDGTRFEDNDSNASTVSGPITALTPSQFDARLRSMQEDYPPQAFKAMMNIGDSHDTNRLRFLLKKINNDDDAAALKRLQEYWLFSLTYAGAPTLYYGDEMALQADGVFANGQWEDDPYNRAPFPWDDTVGAYTAYTETLPFLRALTSARVGYRALQDGNVEHGLVVSDAEKVYAYSRWYTDPEATSNAAFIALNRDAVTHTVTFNSLEGEPYRAYVDQSYRDVVTGNRFTVTCTDIDTPSGCSLTADVPPESGIVLTDPGLADIPDPVLGRIGITDVVTDTTLLDIQLNWAAIIRDAGHEYEFPAVYEVWSSDKPYDYVGEGGTLTLLGEVGAPDFGTDGNRREFIHLEASGDPAVNHYYLVYARNGAGGRSYDSNRMGEFDFALVPGTAEE